MSPHPLARLLAVAGIAIAAARSQDSHWHPVAYHLTPLPGVNPGHGFTVVTALDNRGTAVGESTREQQGTIEDIRSRPMVWRDGAPTELPTLPGGFGLNAGANAINAHGVIAGDSPYPDGHEFGAHATVWIGGHLLDLGALPGDGFSSATALNDRGLVVGISGPEEFWLGDNMAVLWDHGVLRSLGRLPGDLDSVATGVNNHGTIVGISGDLFTNVDGILRAVRWRGGAIETLPTHPGHNTSVAIDINESGLVVGASGIIPSGAPFPVPGRMQPARWIHGGIEVLPVLDGDNAGDARDVNAAGVIVGASAVADEYGYFKSERPVLWAGSRLIDLRQVHTSPPGWEITMVSAINDRGQIAGVGRLGGVETPFLATPARACGH
jgi:uncharacterized membrane protein